MDHDQKEDQPKTHQEEYDSLLKCIVMGDSGAGKTTLCQQFSLEKGKELISNKNPDEAFKPTIGVDFILKTITLPPPPRKRVVKLQVWDTAGQERFQTITRAYFRGADAFLLVFDLTSIESLDSLIGTWIPMLVATGDLHRRKATTFTLVGTKADLAQTGVIDVDTNTTGEKSPQKEFKEGKTEDDEEEEMLDSSPSGAPRTAVIPELTIEKKLSEIKKMLSENGVSKIQFFRVSGGDLKAITSLFHSIAETTVVEKSQVVMMLDWTSGRGGHRNRPVTLEGNIPRAKMSSSTSGRCGSYSVAPPPRLSEKRQGKSRCSK